MNHFLEANLDDALCLQMPSSNDEHRTRLPSWDCYFDISWHFLILGMSWPVVSFHIWASDTFVVHVIYFFVLSLQIKSFLAMLNTRKFTDFSSLFSRASLKSGENLLVVTASADAASTPTPLPIDPNQTSAHQDVFYNSFPVETTTRDFSANIAHFHEVVFSLIA